MPPRKGNASVETISNNPNLNSVSRERAFMASLPQGKQTQTDTYATNEGTGTVSHSRPGTAIMYKPSERNGWLPRVVSVSSVPDLFQHGWHDLCPDCGAHHLDRNGNITDDPNSCTAREPVAVRVCPVCRKRVYDNQSLASATMEDDDDPNVIRDDAYLLASDPATRTKLKLDLHLWIRHPEWAQANGVPQLPDAFREMVEASRGGAVARSG